MIHLYAWATPNGLKPLILLEELEMPYTLHEVDLGAGAQHEEAFRRISPNEKIPALVDDAPTDAGEPLAIFESGPILRYLAQLGGRFLPETPRARWTTESWLAFQIANVGPNFGQAHHFDERKETEAYAFGRYHAETSRLVHVLERRLAEVPYLAGDAYTIADIATWPWVRKAEQWFGIAWADIPNVRRWERAIADRPAVQRAKAIRFGEG
ncbi:MAG: glutathione S-transferase family protein [Planctomycetota bacterium]|jgi:GST-like protein